MGRRGSGILLHITSLPGELGSGDLGPWAMRFADFLEQAGQTYWQVLPLNPVNGCEGNSPYSNRSAFAGNRFLISPELLVGDGLISGEILSALPRFPADRVNYENVHAFRRELLDRSYEVFKSGRHSIDFEEFCHENEYWLEDFALFSALKEHFGGAGWEEWPAGIRDRQPSELRRVSQILPHKIEMAKYSQFIFFRQWLSLKDYCNRRKIFVIGDIPIYVSYQSADVWAHPEIFKLDEKKRPAVVAGVPPDYFSKTGQLWGNPVYRWDWLRETGYDWWVRRIEHNLKLFDMLRIDHFRAFQACWEVDASEKMAINGKWVGVPGADFFEKLRTRFPSLPIIAEDLGTITPDVHALMDKFGFPGMRVLLFAFGDDLPNNPYIPHNHIPNCVVYTGTHDNNTVRGWFEIEAQNEERERLFRYLGRKPTAEDINWEMIRLAMMSVADKVIFPMQDILGLGAESRMNTPSTASGNWEWRLLPEHLTPALAGRLRATTAIYGRLPE